MNEAKAEQATCTLVTKIKLDHFSSADYTVASTMYKTSFLLHHVRNKAD